MLYHIIKNEEYPKEDDQESSEIIDDAISKIKLYYNFHS